MRALTTLQALDMYRARTRSLTTCVSTPPFGRRSTQKLYKRQLSNWYIQRSVYVRAANFCARNARATINAPVAQPTERSHVMHVTHVRASVLRNSTHAHSWPQRAGLPQDARQNMSWRAHHAHHGSAPEQVAPQRRVRTVLGRASAATLRGRPATTPPGHPRLGVNRVHPPRGKMILHHLLVPRPNRKALRSRSKAALRRNPSNRLRRRCDEARRHHRTGLPRNGRSANGMHHAGARVRGPSPLMRRR